MRRIGLNVQLIVINAILLVAIVAAFVAMLVTTSDLGDAYRVSDDERQLILASQLERSVVELQASVRGYVITGQTDFLTPRNRAVRVVPRAERRLLAIEKGGQHSHLKALRALLVDIHAYIAHSNRILSTARKDRSTARAIIATGMGSDLMARVRRGFAAYSAAVAAEARSARADARSSAKRTIAFGVISLIVLALANSIVAALVALGVVRPVRRFAGAARKISAGDLTVRVKEGGAGEIRVLGHTLNEMAASLEESRNERQAQRAQLEQAIEELSAERDRIQRFHDFVADLASARQLTSLGRRMLRDLCELGGASAAALFVTDVRGGTQRLWLASTYRLKDEALPRELEPGEGLAAKALAEARGVQASHAAGELRLPGLAEPVEVRHELHLPVMRGAEVLGVVQLMRERDEAFEQSTIEELEQLMHSAAAALGTSLALRTAENAAELNRTVLDSVQDAYIATDQRGVVEAWSPQATGLFGFPEDEAIGQRLETLLVPNEGGERLRDLTRAAAEPADGPQLERFEVLACRKDGRRVLVEMSMARVARRPEPLVTYFARDIGERRRHEEVRGAAEQVSRALAEADPGEDVLRPILAAIGESLGWGYGAFWLFEERPRQLRCIHVWGEGDRWDEIERLWLNATFDPADSTKESTPMRDAWRSGEPQWNVLSRPAISERRAAVLARGIRAELILPVRGGEGTLGVIEFGSLSTDPPSAETLESLRSTTDLVGQVVERRRAIEEAERLKSEFFALVSHELRTPLTSVMGYLDIVTEEDAGAVNEEQQRYLGVIRRNTERLLRLVGDLLFVAQVEAGTLSLEHATVDLAATVEASVEAACPRAEQQGIDLDVEVEPMTMTEGDKDRLGQLVDNLVSNALKFTPKGGRVSVRLRRIEGDRALIEVADTGMGIPAEEQEHLFERFFRAESATERAIPGIGLGLSICQAIAEGHNGRITVQSEVDHGTTFRVELPLGHIDSERPANII